MQVFRMESELSKAAKNGDLNLVSVLILAGAGVDGAVEGNGYPPLCVAAASGHIEVVKFLIENNADINKSDNCGYSYTPLHQACRKGHLEIVKLLLERGADINVTDRNGATPLHLIFKKGYKDIAHLLIENKANLSIADNYKVLPLLLAFVYQYTEIADRLEKKGACLFLPGDNESVWLDLVRKGIESTKPVIDKVLLQNPGEKKPNIIQQHEVFSNYWDRQVEKINCLSQEDFLGSKSLTETILTKIVSGKKDSLVFLSFQSVFKSLNPQLVKKTAFNQTDPILKLTH